MSRTPRDEAAATLATRALTRRPSEGATLLVMEDPLDLVPEAARERGWTVRRWSRRGAGGVPAIAWPEPGPVAMAALRLPRAKDELEMAVHAAASRLEPGGRLLVYGANDEGIRSAAGRIEPLMGSVGTLATGGHARLLGAVRPPVLEALREGPEAWREVGEVELPWGRVPWVSYPGVFAHGRLDPGTELLMEHLPAVAEGARVLDYGAGSGFLAAAALQGAPGAEVVMLDSDALAVAAARENVPGAVPVVGSGWAALDEAGLGGVFDAVISNPPYHRGKAETLAEVRALVAGAASGVRPGGDLRLVVQRRLPVESLLEGAFRKVSVVADEGPYRVWSGRQARASAVSGT